MLQIFQESQIIEGAIKDTKVRKQSEWRPKPLLILAQSASSVLAQLVCLHARLSLARFEKSGLWVDATHKYVFGLSCV